MLSARNAKFATLVTMSLLVPGVIAEVLTTVAVVVQNTDLAQNLEAARNALLP